MRRVPSMNVFFLLGIFETVLLLQSRSAKLEEVKLVHTTDLVDTVKKFAASKPVPNLANFKAFSEIYNDVYMNQVRIVDKQYRKISMDV